MTATATASPFAALLGQRAPRPDWLRERSNQAAESFEAQGLPSSDDENWRQTSLVPLQRATFRAADAAARVEPAALAPFIFDAHRLVFVNGRFAPGLSDPGALPAGVRLSALGDAPEAARPHLGTVADAARQPFTALNTALLEDAAVVWLEAGARVTRALHILHFSTGGAGALATSHPRTLVVAGRGSQARVVETFAGPPGTAYFTDAVTELVLEDGAVLAHYKLQHESEAAFHVGRIEARQARDSQLQSHSFAFGAAWSRTDVDVHLSGPGADCGLFGLYLGRGTQAVDHHTLIDHAVPRCTSRELYKGVLDERARGAFFGTIVVRKDAQKTDAQQTNKNLLLSREALAQSTPRLQIEADDVRCKHGSTTGQLDPQALFYLRSRAVGEAQARSLLSYAFAADVVARVEVPEVRRALAAQLAARLPGLGDLAEVAS